MISLAVECSTARSSLALFDDTSLIAETDWLDDRCAGTGLLTILLHFLETTQLTLDRVDTLICGRGPGVFSSLRVAMTAVTTAALPSEAIVYALSSGEALAEELLRTNPSPVAIVGDARQETWWYALFSTSTNGLTCDSDWSLSKPSDITQHLQQAGTIASPDYARLVPAWATDPSLSSLPWIRETVPPKARFLGQRAIERMKRGLAGEPLTPIYMHPAAASPERRVGPSTTSTWRSPDSSSG